MPPSTHFFTQAAPLPACLAPHMESEIQPLMVLESAALAATEEKETATTSRVRTRFIFETSGIGETQNRLPSSTSTTGKGKAGPPPGLDAPPAGPAIVDPVKDPIRACLRLGRIGIMRVRLLHPRPHAFHVLHRGLEPRRRRRKALHQIRRARHKHRIALADGI